METPCTLLMMPLRVLSDCRHGLVMFNMREIKCKECGSVIGYSDADYVPLILCAACTNKESEQ